MGSSNIIFYRKLGWNISIRIIKACFEISSNQISSAICFAKNSIFGLISPIKWCNVIQSQFWSVSNDQWLGSFPTVYRKSIFADPHVSTLTIFHIQYPKSHKRYSHTSLSLITFPLLAGHFTCIIGLQIMHLIAWP